MKTYNWQKNHWPHFRYDISTLHATLQAIAEKSGLIRGKLAHLDEHQQSEANEITPWIEYFINVVIKAQFEVEQQISFILMKSHFFEKFADELNERQLKVVKRMMDTGIKGFEGGMSAKKYMSITGSSKATATRDLQQMLTINALNQTGSGRSVRYQLNLK